MSSREMQMLIDLHKPNARLGPGGDAETLQALAMSGLRDRSGLSVADLGCGTGASTLVLAEHLDAEIVAVDVFPEFLAELSRRATARGLSSITPLAASFAELPFEDESLDLIWSEGAIYNLGFVAGVKAWTRFLKPGGVLAVSEITWLTSDRPTEIQSHWDEHYPEIDVASAKLAVLERHGFTPLGYFALPESCWLDNYYRPLEQRFDALLDAYDHSDAVRELVESERRETALYERHKAHVSYGFYIARRL